MADSAAPGPSRSLDCENNPQSHVSPNQPAGAFTIAALILRGLAMLMGEGERPRASGDTCSASAATLELMLAVAVAAEDLWKEYRCQI